MRPLEGKRIVVTRSEEQAESLSAELERLGAIALRCATIRLGPPTSYEGLDAALSRLDVYGWVIFTSVNGVGAVLGRMKQLGLPAARLEGLRVAAVGPGTARALADHGVRPDFVPGEERSLALAESLGPVEGERVLFARGDLANPQLARILLRRGARQIDDAVAYRTLPTAPSPEALEELRRGVDGVTFTSPSTVRGLMLVGPEWRALVADALVATLGPVTSEAAREAGLHVGVEAEERTMAGLAEAVARGFARRPAEVQPEARR